MDALSKFIPIDWCLGYETYMTYSFLNLIKNHKMIFAPDDENDENNETQLNAGYLKRWFSSPDDISSKPYPD